MSKIVIAVSVVIDTTYAILGRAILYIYAMVDKLYLV